MSGSPTGFTVSNTELIEMLPMTASDVFTQGLWSYAVNPGVSAVFPWLSAIALNFQSYRIRKLRFIYRPACSTTANGMTILAFDPDPSNVAPTNVQALSAFRHRVSGQPWTSLILDVPPSALGTLSHRKTIRSISSTAPLSSLPQFDAGTFYTYAGHGTVGLNLCGTLEASYSIEFFEPQPPETGGSSLVVFRTYSGNLALPWQASPVRYGGLGVTASGAASTTTFILPEPGTYSVSVAILGTGLLIGSYALVVLGSTAMNLPQNTGVNAALQWSANYVMTTTDSSSGFTFVNSSGTTATSAWCLITLAPSSVLSL